MKESTLHFPVPHVGRQDTQILDHWRHIVFLCRESNRKGEPHYVIRLILGDRDPVFYGPWKTEPEARAKFAKIEKGHEVFNAFVEIEEVLQVILDSNYAYEY